MEENDDDGEEEATNDIRSCFFFSHYSLGKNTLVTTPLLAVMWLTSWTFYKAFGVVMVAMVQFSKIVNATNFAPLGGGFIINDALPSS
jgi:hypothetical protein